MEEFFHSKGLARRGGQDSGCECSGLRAGGMGPELQSGVQVPAFPLHGCGFSQRPQALADSTGGEAGEDGEGIREAIDKQGGSC